MLRASDSSSGWTGHCKEIKRDKEMVLENTCEAEVATATERVVGTERRGMGRKSWVHLQF